MLDGEKEEVYSKIRTMYSTCLIVCDNLKFYPIDNGYIMKNSTDKSLLEAFICFKEGGNRSSVNYFQQMIRNEVSSSREFDYLDNFIKKLNNDDFAKFKKGLDEWIGFVNKFS